MKYDGTWWCKQTAAIEEGRRCSCSFTHWYACRPGTKGPLMKVLTEAQGARGEGLVTDSRANQTTPHHNVPYHARAILPSLTPKTLYSLPSLCGLSQDTDSFFFSPHSQAHQAGPKEVHFVPDSILPPSSSLFVPPDSVHSSAWT